MCGFWKHIKFLLPMEGKFYVGSLEVHKPNPSPNPNHVPYWEGIEGGGYKISPSWVE